ncbi:PTS sugar transporter subunit IIB [Breznakia pachnodae]|uniref:PTS system cellobiose-specific IIB component n=1 Tax=Breznakia pachnodae TaxID=265178 RepID=A0ABU0E868_9FIRM|nr:PTS sugar transporter subunit IIB [Breznakia pachnodae]MDQ0363015.1 PTS system cellobiose-specific IIB component [Breznakia pachnodae]
MKEVKVLLVCGSGASSGFMASNIRQAVKSRNLNIKVKARSEKDIEEYLDETDLLLIGPHFKHIYNDVKEIADPYHIKVGVIDQEAYGSLDGNAVLNTILNLIGGNDNE